MHKTRILLIILFLVYLPVYVFAYLDPGTGSLLVYALVGLLTSLGFAFRNSFYRLKAFLVGGFNKNTKIQSQNYDIVFHSEGDSYWHVFEPIVKACISKNIQTTFITPDKNDSAYAFEGEYFNVINPGNEVATITFMNRLSAKLVISTTPHLDVYMWKRSKNVGRYAHVFHSPDSIDYYEKYALCFYDDIFLTSGEHEKAIRFLDNKRKLPEKKYYLVGCTYYDYMIQEVKNTKPTIKKPKVLYAPTWGDRSSVIKYGTKIIDNLAQANISVIFRPHPQYKVSHKKVLEDIESKYQENKLVTIDYNRTPIQSMVDSDVLIADISGVVLDYIYLFNKPIILTDSTIEKGGYEAEDLEEYEWQVPTLKKISTELKEEELDSLPALVSKVRLSKSDAQKMIRFREENLSNYGTAGEVAANTIIQIKESIK